MMIEQFHFLRPWWLLALLIPGAVLWLSSRSGDIRSQWKAMIAPHLLDRLIVDAGNNTRIRPVWLLAAALVLASLAAAGPAWQREAPPFVEDTAPLIIVIDLSATMDAIDITPSRLERAKLKIKDIVAARSGARTALIAYAGSAHLVLPLTEDQTLIGIYSDALATRIMPVTGKDTGTALKLAEATLAAADSAGTVLFLTDEIEQKAYDAFKVKTGYSIIVLGIGTADSGPIKNADGGFANDGNGGRITAKLDLNSLKSLHTLTGTDVATMTDDSTDIRWILQKIRTNFAQKQASEGDRWRDMGWWLVLPLVALFAFSFRKGWVVRTGVLLIALQMLTPAKAGEYADAIDAFAAIDTAESWYNQANSLLHIGEFEDAVTAYRTAIARRPNWPEATANLAIAENLVKMKKDEEQEQQEEPNLPPDQIQFDDKGKQGKAGQINIAEQTSELWMKNIQVSPADLMARKFAIEAQGSKP